MLTIYTIRSFWMLRQQLVWVIHLFILLRRWISGIWQLMVDLDFDNWPVAAELERHPHDNDGRDTQASQVPVLLIVVVKRAPADTQKSYCQNRCNDYQNEHNYRPQLLWDLFIASAATWMLWHKHRNQIQNCLSQLNEAKYCAYCATCFVRQNQSQLSNQRNTKRLH